MKLFPEAVPLKFMATDILGQLLKISRGNAFLLVIADRLSKFVRTVSLKNITTATLAKAFVTHQVFIYGPPLWLLSDNGRQFTARSFQHLFQILKVNNMFTKTYHLRCSRQTEKFNHTVLLALCHYVADHPEDWELYTDTLAYAHNTQMHRTTKCAPLGLILFSAPHPLAVAPKPMKKLSASATYYLLRCRQRLEYLLSRTAQKVRKTREKYRRDFNKCIRVLALQIRSGSLFFIGKEYYGTEGKKHKLASIVEGPFEVVSLTPETVLIQDGYNQECISLDRIVEARNPAIALGTDVIIKSLRKRKKKMIPQKIDDGPKDIVVLRRSQWSNA